MSEEFVVPCITILRFQEVKTITEGKQQILIFLFDVTTRLDLVMEISDLLPMIWHFGDTLSLISWTLNLPVVSLPWL
ncbi:hypothetical protein C471_02220 [Halorubrum saccharovorum DSM 1137]|uniref:Uncharacterized protein n=1 Tax=Halorubrum saccharovorum DSM 1137 TaxID=1227484 RepID=M0E4Q8_9EURY|nr:hypothetical protein C471_02220 [Halorubrum saccharovorum DSM 1137]